MLRLFRMFTDSFGIRSARSHLTRIQAGLPMESNPRECRTCGPAADGDARLFVLGGLSRRFPVSKSTSPRSRQRSVGVVSDAVRAS